MLRLGLRLLLASVALAGVGWLSIAYPVFEALRLASVVCLTAAFGLILAFYVRTPDAHP